MFNTLDEFINKLKTIKSFNQDGESKLIHECFTTNMYGKFRVLNYKELEAYFDTPKDVIKQRVSEALDKKSWPLTDLNLKTLEERCKEAKLPYDEVLNSIKKDQSVAGILIEIAKRYKILITRKEAASLQQKEISIEDQIKILEDKKAKIEEELAILRSQGEMKQNDLH